MPFLPGIGPVKSHSKMHLLFLQSIYFIIAMEAFLAIPLFFAEALKGLI
jgi:hypothetical protein